jgi:hypothetical protein
MRTVWLLTEHGVPSRVCLQKPEIHPTATNRYGVVKLKLAPGDEIQCYSMGLLRVKKEKRS